MLDSNNSGSQGDFFKSLKKIKIESEIFYQTNYGNKRYVVTKEIISVTSILEKRLNCVMKV